jgi:hypothetical protein
MYIQYTLYIIEPIKIRFGKKLAFFLVDGGRHMWNIFQNEIKYTGYVYNKNLD